MQIGHPTFKKSCKPKPHSKKLSASRFYNCDANLNKKPLLCQPTPFF